MAIQTDYYAPDFLITIAGEPFRHGANLDVLSVSITETTNRADTFTFSLRPRHPKFERFPSGGHLLWLDDVRFEEGVEIKLELGYINQRLLKLTGRTTAVDISFPESGTPTLRVDGQSLYTRLQRKRRRKPFAAKTDTDLVNEIAADVKLQAEVEPILTQYTTASFQGATYAEILQNRAERFYYEVTVKEEKLIFRQPRYLVNPTAELTLTWGEDLRSFTPRLTTNNIPTQVEVRNTARTGGKDAVVGIVTAQEEPAKLGTTFGPKIVQKIFGDNNLLSRDQSVESPEEARAVARAKLRKSAIDYIQGQGSTIGNPTLVSGKVIELKGLGQRFSGNYYITSTTHTIDANGYRTEFQVKRDGV